jgi:hypothetical protein
VERYQLPAAPRPVERRRDRIVVVLVLAVVLLLVWGIALVEGIRPSTPAWLVWASAEAVLVLVVWLTARRLDPTARAQLAASQRTVLGPIEPGSPESAMVGPLGERVEVALRPGRWRRRRHPGSAHDRTLVVDRIGLDVPRWLVGNPPADLTADARLLVPWTAVTRWRVSEDSDGPDLHELAVTRPGQRDLIVRIHRRPIVDEVALLDAVRSLGRCPVELTTSLCTGGSPAYHPDPSPPSPA